jgi:hypothetical protein
VKRSVDKLLDDILRAAVVADEIVRRGRANFESDPVAQYGAEAAVGRIGDAASKLPEAVRASMPGLPWKEIIGFRSSSTTPTTGWTTAASGTRCATTLRGCRWRSSGIAAEPGGPGRGSVAGVGGW